MNSRPGRIEHEFSYGDRHPARSLIAQAQDPFVVRHHDQPHIPLPEILQPLDNLAPVRGAKEEPARPAINVAELLAC